MRRFLRYAWNDVSIKEIATLAMTILILRMFVFLPPGYDYLLLSLMERGGAVYILTNKWNTTLYVGVTSELYPRIVDHKEKKDPKSFTSRYNLSKLVYYEGHYSIEEAIAREKQLKAGSRKKKEDLINSINPDWKDLFDDISKW